MCLTPQDRVAIAIAQARIAFVKDTAAQRMNEMEASDPSPNDGHVEVGKLKEGK